MSPWPRHSHSTSLIRLPRVAAARNRPHSRNMPPTKSGPAKPPVVQTKKRKPADGSSKKKKGSAWTKVRSGSLDA